MEAHAALGFRLGTRSVLGGGGSVKIDGQTDPGGGGTDVQEVAERRGPHAAGACPGT